MRHFQSSQKDVIKEKILNQLKEEELQVISLTDNKEIYWEEKGEEFLFRGEMYDVVKTKTVNGKVMLYCINDKKERGLVDNYNLVTKHNSSSDKKGKNTIDNSFNLFVYQDEKTGESCFIDLPNNFSSINFNLPENLIDNISPPPKA